MQESLEEAKFCTDILELYNTERALHAANLSIEEAHGVGRITQLAYVFLPLTFVTGIFGMNITPFKEGAPMWQFWTSLLLILLPAWGFGVWTARMQIQESLKRRQILSKMKHFVRDSPDKLKRAAISRVEDWTTRRRKEKERSSRESPA